MVTPQFEGYGLGVSLLGDGPTRLFGHGGSNHGYECALIGTVSERSSAAVMTNSADGAPLIESLLATVTADPSWHQPTG